MYKISRCLAFLLLFKLVSAKETAIEPVTSFVPDANTRKPLKVSVEKAKGSICIIKAGTRGERRGTGVLIKPDLVVTSMHTFQATASSGIVGAADVQVAFGIVQGEMGNISNWIDVEDIEPLPNNNDAISNYNDFVILKLKEDATAKGGNVVDVHWKWGLESGGASVQSLKGFMLHCPITVDDQGVQNFDKIEMQISYAVSTDAAVLRPNIFSGIQHPMTFSWAVFKEFPSSSGGGLFDDDGKLLGIIKGETDQRQLAMGKPKNVFIIPIDYIIDNSSGSTIAKAAFNNSTKTIPDGVNRFIYTLLHSGSDLDAPENSSHFGPTLQQPGQTYSFELSSMVRGASDGIYKIRLIVQLSCNEAYNLFNYQNAPVIELSTTGTDNTLLKDLFTVKDIVTNNTTSPSSYCSGVIEFEAKIKSPQNAKFTVKASSAFNSIFNENLGALFSINGGNGQRVRSIDGSTTTGSGGSGKPRYWSVVTIIDDPNVAAGAYVVGRNGEKYDLLGNLINPAVPFNDYEIHTYGLTASFVGGVHQFDNYDIYWGDGTMETVSNSNYIGKVHSHRYSSPGQYKIESKYRYKDLWNNVYRDVIRKPPITISGFSPDVPSTEMILIETERGFSTRILAAATEVTQAEYYQITSKLPAEYFSLESAANPIEKITWYDAIIFCNKKSLKEGLQPVYSYNNPIYRGANCIGFSDFSGDLSKNGYRLPTTGEWNAIYDVNHRYIIFPLYDILDLDRVSWYDGNSSGKTHPVAQKIPNPWGLYDIEGNVSVWGHHGSLEELGVYANYYGRNFKNTWYSTGNWFFGAKPDTTLDYVGMRLVRNAPAAPSISANVVIDQTTFPVKATFSFTNTGGNINYVLWDFGDGIISYDLNPIHFYNKTGTFTARCLVYGEGGSGKSADLSINIPELGVYIKDEFITESSLAKIRMYVANNTPYPINNFSANYYFNVEDGKSPVIDVYSNSSGNITIENVSNGLYKIRYDFTGQTLNPGATLPSIEGSFIGLHYSDWSTMNKSDDFSNPNSSSFVLSKQVSITSNTDGALIQGQIPQYTPIVDSVVPDNPFIITGSTILDVTPTENTYTYINASYHHGMMFTIRNIDIDDSVTVKWYGVLDQNASDCMNRSVCLKHSANLNGNGAQINNICTSRDENGTMSFQLKAAKACKVYIEIFDWVNGIGCR